MKNHFLHLLREWNSQKHDREWVLGTVIGTSGSSYRKAGAFMLFDDVGQRYGLLSGGCLESDLHRKAGFALFKNRAMVVRYDTSDESELAYEIGMGCGGIVDILLQPVTQENNYLELEGVLDRLNQGDRVLYKQLLPEGNDGDVVAMFESAGDANFSSSATSTITLESKTRWHSTEIESIPTLLIFGGGIDAQPVTAIADILGWETILIEPRVSHLKRSGFKSVSIIENETIANLQGKSWLARADAAIVMTHNVNLDAQALSLIKDLHLKYAAILGPHHRTEKVLNKAGLTLGDFRFDLIGPAGLDIGGSLPESIAMSILSQCHATLWGRSGYPLNTMSVDLKQVANENR